MLDATTVPQRRLSPLEVRFRDTFTPPPLYLWQLLQKQWVTGEAKLRVLSELSARDRVAVDVGSGKGVHAYYLSWCSAHVHAFEPNPRLFKILARALPANVTAHELALGEHAQVQGELIVPMHGSVFSNPGGSLNPRKKAKRHSTVDVDCRSLDSFGLKDVGLIRIDVGGCERAVLMGAQDTLARCRPALIVEMKESAVSEPIENTLAFILAMGMEGAFLRGDDLHPLPAFDAEVDHRRRLRQPGCVTTFIFRPV